MAARDAVLMQGNVLQSAFVTIMAGSLLVVFKPTPSNLARTSRGLLVGCAKRFVNGLAVYGCCTMMDALRRNGFNFWFLNNKIGQNIDDIDGKSEYFLSSSFRFATFAASSGASCIANYATKLIGLYGPQKCAPQTEGIAEAAHSIETTEGAVAKRVRASSSLTQYLSRVTQFYDVDGALTPYTNLARVIVHTGIYGIATVLNGASLVPVTLGAIDNETHVRVIRACGPSELAYWSTLTALSTLAAESVWNGVFYVAYRGAEFENADGTAPNSVGFTIFATTVVGIAAAALNGASVYLISNRAVAVLGEDGEKQGSGFVHTCCKTLHDKVFTRIFDKNKGVAYIWARTIGFLANMPVDSN